MRLSTGLSLGLVDLPGEMIRLSSSLARVNVCIAGDGGGVLGLWHSGVLSSARAVLPSSCCSWHVYTVELTRGGCIAVETERGEARDGFTDAIWADASGPVGTSSGALLLLLLSGALGLYLRSHSIRPVLIGVEVR